MGRSDSAAQGRGLRGSAERQGQSRALPTSGDRPRSVGRDPHEKRRGPVSQPDSPGGGDSMTTYYPVVIDTEASGALSAYVPGLPVYAAAETRSKVEQAIRATLAAYL